MHVSFIMKQSGINRHFTAHVEKAYNSFVKHARPFSVVKINIPKQIENRKHIENIVDSNFRGTRDVISKGSNSYSVLMQNTTIEAAITASTRLVAKFYNQDYSCNGLCQNQALNAQVDIMGCGKYTKEVRFTRFDLSQAFHAGNGNVNIPYAPNKYIECQKLLSVGQVPQRISIRV